MKHCHFFTFYDTSTRVENQEEQPMMSEKTIELRRHSAKLYWVLVQIFFYNGLVADYETELCERRLKQIARK